MQATLRSGLRWIVDVLNQHQIPYQISGGLAAAFYGSPRPVNDIDIDISENHFSLVLPSIHKYITYGPRRFNDGKFDCELITLNYYGQEIDLTGVESLRISNRSRTVWLTQMICLADATPARIEDVDIQIIPPGILIAYKQQLDGEHQRTDIEAVQRYMGNMRAVPLESGMI